MENIREEINYKGYKIIASYSDDNPRVNDTNIGTFYTNRRAYNPDGHAVLEFGDYQEECEKNLKEKYLFYPISYYEHGGITISAMKFCEMPEEGSIRGWDNGFFGFYAVKKDDGNIECMKIDDVKECMLSEIKEYDAYLQGEVYAYEIKNQFGEIVDSCCGWYGEDGYEAMIDEAKMFCDNNPMDSFELTLEMLSYDALRELYYMYSDCCEHCKELMDYIADDTLERYIKAQLCAILEDKTKEGIVKRFNYSFE